jgi:hypothetical protein
VGIPLGQFRIISKIRGDDRSSSCTTGVVDTSGAPSLANISANFQKSRNEQTVIFSFSFELFQKFAEMIAAYVAQPLSLTPVVHLDLRIFPGFSKKPK